MWDYQRGREGGWIPKGTCLPSVLLIYVAHTRSRVDPRDAVGHCPSISSFDGVYAASATGGSLDSTASTESIPFPPTALATPSGVSGTLMAYLPTLTPTGTWPVLEGVGGTGTIGSVYVYVSDTFTKFALGETDLSNRTIPHCSYPSAWDAVDFPLPTAPCSGY
jgi:glucan 1,3-beta-glucosidase